MKVSGLPVNFILSAFSTVSVNYYNLYSPFLQHDPKLVWSINILKLAKKKKKTLRLEPFMFLKSNQKKKKIKCYKKQFRFGC